MNDESSNSNPDRESTVQVRNHSVGVRVSIGARGNEAQPVEPHPEDIQPSFRVPTASTHMNAATGEMRKSEVQRVQVGGAFDLSGDSGLLATARTRFGGPAHEIRPDTIVRIEGGYDIDVRTAVQLGLLRKTADGYAEIAKADQAAAEAAKAEALKPEPQPSGAGDVNKMVPVPFAEEVQNTLDIIAEGKTEAEWSPLFMAYVAGKDDQRSFDDMAARLGWGHEQTEAFLTTAQAAFKHQQHEVLAKAGIVDPAAFRTWCEENRVAEHDRAVTNHIVARSLEDFRLLAEEYVRSVVPSEETLRKAGYETMIDYATGALLVKIDGVWQRAKAATRQGRL